MADKEKADQQASPSTTPLHDTSGDAQRARMLARLQEGPVDTLTARRELNILMPAARVKELKDMGHDIRTHLGPLHDDQGRLHWKVATYYLSAGRGAEV